MVGTVGLTVTAVMTVPAPCPRGIEPGGPSAVRGGPRTAPAPRRRFRRMFRPPATVSRSLPFVGGGLPDRTVRFRRAIGPGPVRVIRRGGSGPGAVVPSARIGRGVPGSCRGYRIIGPGDLLRRGDRSRGIRRGTGTGVPGEPFDGSRLRSVGGVPRWFRHCRGKGHDRGTGDPGSLPGERALGPLDDRRTGQDQRHDGPGHDENAQTHRNHPSRQVAIIRGFRSRFLSHPYAPFVDHRYRTSTTGTAHGGSGQAGPSIDFRA
jgi:hypothetical protein